MLISMVTAQVSAQTGEQTAVTENATLESTSAVGDLLSQDIQEELSQQESATGYNVTDLTIENNLALVKYSALQDIKIFHNFKRRKQKNKKQCVPRNALFFCLLSNLNYSITIAILTPVREMFFSIASTYCSSG